MHCHIFFRLTYFYILGCNKSYASAANGFMKTWWLFISFYVSYSVVYCDRWLRSWFVTRLAVKPRTWNLRVWHIPFINMVRIYYLLSLILEWTKFFFVISILSHPQILRAGFYREARDTPGSKSTVTITTTIWNENNVHCPLSFKIVSTQRKHNMYYNSKWNIKSEMFNKTCIWFLDAVRLRAPIDSCYLSDLRQTC